MITVWHWTIVVSIGLVFSVLNILGRNKNIKAVHIRHINGAALFVARWMRNSEVTRFLQLIVLWLIGFGVIAAGYGWISPSLARWILKNLGGAFLIFAYGITFNTMYAWFQSRRVLAFQTEKKGKRSSDVDLHDDSPPPESGV